MNGENTTLYKTDQDMSEIKEIIQYHELFVEILNNTESIHDGRDGIFEGMKIMKKYNPKWGIQAAEHDKVYGPDIYDLIEAEWTKEDVIALAQNGWGFDEENDCIYHFA